MKALDEFPRKPNTSAYLDYETLFNGLVWRLDADDYGERKPHNVAAVIRNAATRIGVRVRVLTEEDHIIVQKVGNK